MNRLIEWWARNPVAANLLMVGIFVAGVIGFTSLDREMDPQVRFPGLEIEAAGFAPLSNECELCNLEHTDTSIRAGGAPLSITENDWVMP